MKIRFIGLTIVTWLLLSCGSEKTICKQWDVLSLDFEGPMVAENDEDNPILNYRLMVEFRKDNEVMRIPGYFAADGHASETSATAGNIWRVNFRPPSLGIWTYKASFRKGDDIAVLENIEAGQPVAFDGASGVIKVIPGDFDDFDFKSKGRLEVVGGGYQRFAASGDYFIKGGAGSPENFLAYADFDGTYDVDDSKFLHHYEPHVQDWNAGDPTWQGGKGKGIIGALNYLKNKGMNSLYFLTMNIEGDGKDMWPYASHTDFTRFDCSKLDQWNIVFEHAQSNGIFLHILVQETENETLLDNGETGRDRKLYFRELIARFGHHLAVEWDMGEENGPVEWEPVGQSTAQQKAMFDYFKKNDPYHNLIAIHTHAADHERDSITMPLLGYPNLDALSMQIDRPAHVTKEFLEWKNKSKAAGRELILYMDEIGPYWQGVSTDANDMAHDTIRREVLWGSLMVGGAGVEWYFGYQQPPADLDCEDWRTRDAMWDQTKYALDFFQRIPFHEMKPTTELLNEGGGLCFSKPSEVYAVYLPFGRADAIVEVPDNQSYTVQWYNPRTGETTSAVESGMVKNGQLELGKPPVDDGMDWAVLIKAI